MTAKKTRIAGISLGTRSIGIALLQDGELLDWKVQCFKGAWSKSKLSLIVGAISSQIDKHEVSAVVLKIPTEIYPSRGVVQLIRALQRVGVKKALDVRVCTLTDLKKELLTRDEQTSTKKKLIALVTEKYPELQHEYRKEQRNRNAYYCKVFEAVACAMLIPACHK